MLNYIKKHDSMYLMSFTISLIYNNKKIKCIKVFSSLRLKNRLYLKKGD